KRVVEIYRRIRNTLRFLLANTSDFDITRDAVPVAEMLELDRWAIARAAQVQAETLTHFKVYEFHPVVAKLQTFASDDLGGFYLDIIKDRLYTTAPGSFARRSAQTAIWHFTASFLRLIAPFMSFTAEEAFAIFSPNASGTIFTETFADLPAISGADALLAKWEAVRAVRTEIQKQIEAQRELGQIGSSLQAEVDIHLHGERFDLLASL
ncbi:MAG: class I tRNA ligase family protein, partial [Burkholderiaceae bacterium]